MRRQCECGCGETPAGGMFLPGHDQRLRKDLEERVGGLLALRGVPRLLGALLLLAACESFVAATPPASGPAPDMWGQALFARLGYTPEQVLAAIGEPTGRTVEGNRETWTYVHADRPGYASGRVGTVTFEDGVVTGAEISALLTP